MLKILKKMDNIRKQRLDPQPLKLTNKKMNKNDDFNTTNGF